MIHVGIAGWSLAAVHRKHAPETGTHLERYAAVFNSVEITSSFYRSHQHKTYVRWSASVPGDFRFSVKLPRTITHEAKLVDAGGLLDQFLWEVSGLGEKLGALVVQFAPRHEYDAPAVDVFFREFRTRYAGPLACEPRHASWFTGEADGLLVQHRVARIAADPLLHHGADTPGGWRGLGYWRWHGSPVVYRSKYEAEAIAALTAQVRGSAEAWVIFDNTMLGHAFFDAIALRQALA